MIKLIVKENLSHQLRIYSEAQQAWILLFFLPPNFVISSKVVSIATSVFYLPCGVI